MGENAAAKWYDDVNKRRLFVPRIKLIRFHFAWLYIYCFQQCLGYGRRSPRGQRRERAKRFAFFNCMLSSAPIVPVAEVSIKCSPLPGSFLYTSCLLPPGLQLERPQAALMGRPTPSSSRPGSTRDNYTRA